MPPSTGDHLGPYEILESIGKGGMGEVFKARDPRLNRDVAIKISAEQFTDRFTREAKAIAALNHTNICHLYDVGPNYIVLEYVEGEDLKGPLTFEDALPIIHQLIDGIEAAHEKNIVHRDLKPANIKLTPDGVVKILDFGLAKAMDPAASQDRDPANSPTMTIAATAAGAILGTAAYMSPEQAKGKSADRRGDIWSFGVILYELLTGERLFSGESAVEILGAVINQKADLTAAGPRAQPLLQCCLERDRKDRLQSIGDARRLLREQPVVPSLPKTPERRLLWPAAAAIFAFAFLALAGWNFYQRAAGPAPIVKTAIFLPEGLRLMGSNPVSVSPDGRRIIFAGIKSGVRAQWMRGLDELEARMIPGTEAALAPFLVA